MRGLRVSALHTILDFPIALPHACSRVQIYQISIVAHRPTVETVSATVRQLSDDLAALKEQIAAKDLEIAEVRRDVTSLPES